MDGSCDVSGCQRVTYMGWRPLTESRGRQICEGHWRRHKDPNDSFDLFEAFGFRRPAGIGKPVPKKEVARCTCGRERLPGRRLCTICAEQRERERKKRAYHERKNRHEMPVEPEPVLRCRACGEPREAGHRYCSKCAQKREKQSNRERRRRCYRKSLKRVGPM